MLNRITKKTVALGVQLCGVVMLAVSSLPALRSDYSVLSLGAFTFISGCLLEAQTYSQASAEDVESADTPLSDSLT